MEKKRFGRGVVLTAWIAIFLGSVTEGCRCPDDGPRLLHDLVCRANFVIQITVTGGTVVADGQLYLRKYHISIMFTYKRTGDFENVFDMNSLYTPSSGPACGVTLNIGSTYLIGGYVSDGNLWLHRCDLLNREVSTLTMNQMWNLISGHYTRGCRVCDIKYCNNPMECSLASFDRGACVASRSNSQSFSCLDKNDFCITAGWWGSSRCRWAVGMKC